MLLPDDDVELEEEPPELSEDPELPDFVEPEEDLSEDVPEPFDDVLSDFDSFVDGSLPFLLPLSDRLSVR